MPTDGAEAVANIAARLNAFPTRRRAIQGDAAGGGGAGARQPRATSSSRSPSSATSGPTRRATTSSTGSSTGSRPTVRWPPSCGAGAAAATAATAEFGAVPARGDGPGRPGEAGRRARALRSSASQYFLGAKVDLDETYAWGFEELARLESEMRAVAAQIVGPGASIDDAVEALDADPARSIQGKEAFRDWMQALGRQGDRRAARHPLRHPRAGPADRVPASRRPATAASTTPARAKTSPARAHVVGGARRASRSSRPGAR